MSDIAFDEGMGFDQGLGGPRDAGENARQKAGSYVKRVRASAPPDEADAHERTFRLALEQRVAAEIAKAKDPLERAHLNQVLEALAADLRHFDEAARRR